MTMRVGVNLLWCVPSVVGGTEEYAVRTTASFLDREVDDVELVLFVLRPFADAYPELVGRCRTVVAELDGRNRPRRVVAESTWLRQQTRAERVQLLHHVGGTVPTLRPVPAVLTLHDLQPLALPQNFGFVKRHYLRAAIPRSVARAEFVVAPSDFVRGEVIRRFGLTDDRVVTVSAGYDLPRLPELDSSEVPTEVRRLVEARQHYFVYPAITHHHKDHATALRAIAVAREHGHDVHLVFTGGSGHADADVERLIDTLGLGAVVHRLGRVDRRVLDLLVANAEALLFPSRFEGFGIPVLEAMALGCPVIAADATAVPEVAGEAGRLVPPGDIDAWAKAIADRIANVPDRGIIAAAGKRQAAEYAWDRAGERMEMVYRRALDTLHPLD